MPPLRVLIIETQNSDGPWHYAVSLSRALAQADVRTALATLFPYEELGDHDGVRLYAIGKKMPLAGRGAGTLVRRMVRHLGKLNRLRRTVVEFRPDVVHISQTPLGGLDFLYFRLLRLMKIGLIYTAHDARPLDRRRNWFDLARYRAADAILVHSSSDLNALVADGIDESKITVIPHGTYVQYCPDQDASPIRAKAQLGLPAQGRVILFFGTIAPYKGLDLLIEAFARLRDEDANTYLVIAGKPLEDFAPYRRRIQELNLVDRVLLDLRYIPFAEFPKYFSAADLVAFPYRRISQSGVLQLAYAYRRPVVVTNVGGLAEAVAEDRTGMIATTFGADELSSAMRRVLADPEEAMRMGERGRRLADSKYSWGPIVEKIAHVYESVRRAQARTRTVPMGGTR